ncbi:tRNA 2-selenouridine(34) synthase MnmH [Biformimicrobium ophioploci]|uniref:tRNA 2-selenouridine synthase n=1 Tax=Biformimicrobium ophioploci TaxID=3036711 RepID=A0ABQ6M0X0_9GAMM|nr:tRNA 2-selenouridine(34) synthase MnmH [Microbulbifer sp. NKW57]GMG87978.1 tRNA 2-selenouridine(34) synthase MnmH [Microbulbifer sp. NKW57]
MRPDTDDYLSLFLNDVPLMDVRAPVEFNKGAFPSARNVPLLDDIQRAKVGTRYKEQGQDAAIELGWQLATKKVRAQRLEDWSAFTHDNPEGYLYCFRGGLRSRTTQKMLREAGVDYPLVIGGYKAMRTCLLEQLERLTEKLSFIVIAGSTGSGKTDLLRHRRRAVCLESLANHRGSAFGRNLAPQPSQISFENALSIALLKLEQLGEGPIFVEDESHLIGRCALPTNFLHKLKASPTVLVDEPPGRRAQRIVRDYVTDRLPEYVEYFGEEARPRMIEDLRGNLGRIKRRLGGLRYRELDEQLEAAGTVFCSDGTADGIVPVVEVLLSGYYDGMYGYQLEQQQGKRLFRGDWRQVADWLAEQEGSESKR